MDEPASRFGQDLRGRGGGSCGRLLCAYDRLRSQAREPGAHRQGVWRITRFGIVLLARLAVDRSQQGKGLGKALLFDALTRIAEAADIVAVRAVMVHAIDQAARGFYEHFEFEPSPVNPFQLLLLLKDLRKAVKSLPAWIAPPGAEKFRRLSLLKIRHPSNTVLHDPSSRSPRRTRRSRCLRSKSDSPARGPRPEPASRPHAADEALAPPTFPLAHRSRTRQSAPTRKARPVSSTLERPALLAAPK